MTLRVFFILLILVALFVVWQFVLQRPLDLPSLVSERVELPEGEATNTTISINENVNGSVIQVPKDILETDGVRHSVPLDNILSGGPPKDGIPSIDDPQFLSVAAADELLEDEEPGIAIERNGVHRFYPFQILVWHEIVNDTLPAPSGVEGAGERILITYCPLCISGIVFDPVVQGERVEFGTSGKLWNSNLVMYDRKTDSLWSQVLGEAIVGEMTGTKLTVLPSDQLRYGEWKRLHPDGEVLSRDTGTSRSYGRDPYGNYYTTPGTYFPVDHTDDRLSDKAYVLGVVINGKAKAYLPETIKARGTIEDSFAGKTIVGEYDPTLDVVRLFEKAEDDSLKRINPFPNFWFSWVAAHPETDLFL